MQKDILQFYPFAGEACHAPQHTKFLFYCALTVAHMKINMLKSTTTRSGRFIILFNSITLIITCCHVRATRYLFKKMRGFNY
ncbi:MAG: hypothetical protein JWP37_1262 [Mucilaginibacter sp.]|nr:hypothetical protein [Mucilaginibacter sp.]